MTAIDELLSGFRVVDLARPLSAETAVSPSRPGFQMALRRRHEDGRTATGESGADELIATSTHIGTHVDALSHVSVDGLLHGGIAAAEATRGGRFTSHGIETMAPVVARGVLLDLARDAPLPPAYEITAGDVRDTGVGLRRGDAVLVRTGWGGLPESPRLVGAEGGVPGVGLDAARLIADAGAVVTGTDTFAYEPVPAGGIETIPVHALLLAERGIHIVESLDLEELAGTGATEFVFVLLPLKIVGATGSPARPIALVPRPDVV